MQGSLEPRLVGSKAMSEKVSGEKATCSLSIRGYVGFQQVRKKKYKSTLNKANILYKITGTGMRVNGPFGKYKIVWVKKEEGLMRPLATDDRFQPAASLLSPEVKGVGLKVPSL